MLIRHCFRALFRLISPYDREIGKLVPVVMLVLKTLRRVRDDRSDS